jgi:membrane-associated phospholipid phosphatase
MAETLRGEEAALVAVQSALADRPGVLTGARPLAFRRAQHRLGRGVRVGRAAAAVAPPGVAGRGRWRVPRPHAAAVVIKRVVKRERPHHPAVAVNVGTPSRLSFPSAHATSTTAASILLARTTGLPLPVVLVPPMALSRLVLGVHYPSDVLIGVAVGAVVAKTVGAVADRVGGDG